MAVDEQLKREIQALADRTQQLLDDFERIKVNIALIGEPGVGKSSLINAMVGRPVAQTGATGETTMMVQSIPHDAVEGLVFWDLPGCGTPNHPRETYIEQQRLLSDYDVFILVTDKRIRQGDEWLYRKLCTEAGRPFFIVRTHFDQVVDELDESDARIRITDDVRQQLHETGELRVYVVALKGPTAYDLGSLVEDVIESLTGMKKEKAALAIAPLTEELLRKKRQSAEQTVNRYALLAAANGFNPVPGLDLSVDVGLLAMMAGRVIAAYGLREDQLNFVTRRNVAAGSIKLIRQIARPVAEYLAREGILLVLKRLGSELGARSVAKWVPLVGQAVASYLGYKITIGFGMQLIDDCEKASTAIARILHTSEASGQVSEVRDQKFIADC